MTSPYLYWLVRYVPDVARGERVNVAIIAGLDGGDWAIRTAPDLRRASRLGGDAGALRPWLESLDQTIRDYTKPPLSLFAPDESPNVTRSWLDSLSHRFNNVLQISPPAPVEAESAREAVDFLYPVLVATPRAPTRSVTRRRMVDNLSELYVRTGSLEMGESLLRRPHVQVGRQRGRFEFAVIDEHVDQLSHAFAFDVRDIDALEQELQSWHFVVSRLRSSGARLSSGTQLTLNASANVPIAVAFQDPAAGAQQRMVDVFEAAREAWTSLGVEAVPSQELDRIAIEARDLLAAA